MPTDDILQPLPSQNSHQQQGVSALIRGIHRLPGLREWVTLESISLVPIPVQQNQLWRLLALITVPSTLEDGTHAYAAPWALIEWSWPDLQVVNKIDLRQRQDLVSLRMKKTIAKQPADSQVTIDRRSQILRENELFQAIDTLLSTAPDDNCDLSQLASHYAGLLPADLYAYYHILAPKSQVWLNPNVPAVPLTLTADWDNQKIETSIPMPSKPTAVQSDQQSKPLPHPESSSPSTELTAGQIEAMDLTPEIGSWLRQCLALAESFVLEDIVTQLQHLNVRRRLPNFRLAFVGEFSRGKSTLINRLLDQDILPIGATPTTATLTSIMAGTDNQMEVRLDSDSLKEIRPLEEASWQDLLATDATGQNHEVLSAVRILLNNDWLQQLDVELIDTPGAGDLSTYRAALVFDLLSQCDASVLLVSATLPFSITEARFLEDEIIGRHIPRVFVAVSKLDTLPMAERADVMNALHDRISKISTTIPIVPIHPPDESMTDQSALDGVRKQIEVMLSKGERRLWRHRQIAGQLADVLGQMMALGHSAQAQVKMDQAERQQALHLAQEALQEADLQWEQLRLELEQRRFQRDRELRQYILAAKQNIVESLAYELERTSDPQTWWKRDVPFFMRRHLLSLSRQFEDRLLKAIAQDVEWLQVNVSQSFSGPPSNFQVATEQQALNAHPNFEKMTLTNPQRYRLLTRIGSSAAMVCGYIFGGPIGVVASTGVWILGEQIINKEVETQRQIISEALDKCVERVIDEYCIRASERLEQLYRKLIEDTKKEQSAWQKTQKSLLEDSTIEQEGMNWQELIDQATELQRKILDVLS